MATVAWPSKEPRPFPRPRAPVPVTITLPGHPSPPTLVGLAAPLVGEAAGRRVPCPVLDTVGLGLPVAARPHNAEGLPSPTAVTSGVRPARLLAP